LIGGLKRSSGSKILASAGEAERGFGNSDHEIDLCRLQMGPEVTEAFTCDTGMMMILSSSTPKHSLKELRTQCGKNS
jgi:hypothetical protein